MGVAIRGLDEEQTLALTRAMLDSGESWRLRDEFPRLADKHSTGGVGDSVSIVLAPLLASLGIPVAMLTGRGLGHTAGTADKLEAIPGITQELDRARAVRLLRETGMALGVATSAVAPADRRLYALRDRTATVDSLPLIVASILSKKLALGAAALVFDVKVGDAAFLPELAAARELAKRLVGISRGLGVESSALLTSMDEPLGEWAGHAAEVRESLECLSGGGPEDTVEVTLALAGEVARLVGADLGEGELRLALASGSARETFARWAVAQGAEASWFENPKLPLAPVESVLVAPCGGYLSRIATRRLGELLGAAGAARAEVGGELDRGVALRTRVRVGDRLEAGQEMARVYLRHADASMVAQFSACYELDDAPAPRLPVVLERVG
jgi:pyrimidine-nucleoside phosphorylase